MIDSKMISSTNDIAGYEIVENLGFISRVGDYPEQAKDKLIELADNINANAIVGVHMQTYSTGGGSYRSNPVMIYGTAVKVKKK